MLRMMTGIVIGLSLTSSVASARSLQCNKDQSLCLTESTQLTIGDRVGIFNSDDELVATGDVSSMKGDRRAVLINQRHGSIRKGYSLTLLDNRGEGSESSETMYKIYREPAKVAVGGSVGYSTVSIGDGSPATEFSAFAQWRKWKGMQVIARGTYTAMEGQVTRNSEIGYEHLPISISTIGALGGVGYILRENKPLSFRGELAAGAMYLSGNIDGDADLVDDSSTNSHVKNGLAPGARWSVGAVWNLTNWHLHGDIAQTIVHQAFANTLALGVSKDMK